MTKLNKEIENTHFMSDKLVQEVTEHCASRKNELEKEDFSDVENDDAELRSRHICFHDETATSLMNITAKSADINWEAFLENLDETSKKELTYHLTENT